MESGEQSEWCPGGAFTEGKNEVSESTETSSANRSKGALRRLRLRGRRLMTKTAASMRQFYLESGE